RHRRKAADRQAKALHLRAPRGRDRGRLPRRPGAPRRLQPRGRAARARDPRAHAPRRAGGRAEPLDRDAARPRRRGDRIGRLALPAGAARLGLERARARAAGNAIAAQATKILMNSLFGVLGSPASRLFSPAVANAITTAGQHVIRLAAAAVADAGHRVIYGDTDSLFVDL